MACNGLLLRGKRKINPQDPYADWTADETRFELKKRYCKGGFCPITVYQKLKDDRYMVIWKLGKGSSATVWLAKDEHEDRNVALKILTADASANSLELKLLRAVTEPGASSPTYLASLLDEFVVKSVNGDHQVLVLQIAKPIMAMRGLLHYPSVLKSILTGCDKMHSTGMVHGGRPMY